MNDWQEQQRADETARIQQCLEALAQAERFGTPHEVVELLAYECGVGEIYRKLT